MEHSEECSMSAVHVQEITNKYYIVKLDDPNLDELLKISVGNLEDQRTSLDGKLILLKLFMNDCNTYKILSSYICYNHSEIIQLLEDSNWTINVLNKK